MELKALFVYYSGTGNTKAALDAIARSLDDVKVDFFNIVHAKSPPDFLPPYLNFSLF